MPTISRTGQAKPKAVTQVQSVRGRQASSYQACRFADTAAKAKMTLHRVHCATVRGRPAAKSVGIEIPATHTFKLEIMTALHRDSCPVFLTILRSIVTSLCFQQPQTGSLLASKSMKTPAEGSRPSTVAGGP